MKTVEKKKSSEKRLVEVWAEKMWKAHNEFAMIITTKAIYDRVAIVVDLPTILTVQFPKGNPKNKNLKSGHARSDNFTIVQENISKRDVLRIRYYKD